MIILLMSEQKDGHLQLPSSHNFKREQVGNYKSNSINSQDFYQWSRNNMYRSSYAQHHSPVFLPSPRNPPSHAHNTSLAIWASSPRTEPKVSTPRPSPTRPNLSSVDQKSTSTDPDWPPLASTSARMLLLTGPRMLQATCMANLRSKSHTQGGS